MSVASLKQLIVLVVLWACLGGKALAAAAITSINLERHLVYIDKGIVDGFDEGTKICFVIKDASVICGKIVKAALYQAQVLLKDDMQNLFEAYNTKPESVSVKRTRRKKPQPEGRASETSAETAMASKPSRAALRLLWTPTLSTFTAIGHNRLSYVGSTSARKDSLWTSSAASPTLNWQSLGGELTLKKLYLTLGGNFRVAPQETALDYYDDPKTGHFDFATRLTGSEFGVYADATYTFTSGLALGLGLEYKNAWLAYSAYSQDATGSQEDSLIYEYLGSLKALYLRIPLRYDLALGDGKFGLSFGTTAQVKLATLSTSTDPFANDRLNGNKNPDPLGDFESAFGFKANVFNLSFAAGVFLGF